MTINVREIELGGEIPAIRRLVTVEASQAYSRWPEIRSLHTDEDIAHTLGFPSLLMAGQVGASLVSEMCLHLFGRSWAQGGRLQMKFIRPVFVPHCLTIRGVVREKSPEHNGTRVSLDVWIENEDGERVQVGAASAVLFESIGL